jgi:ATP-dependent exoDNAse (exonuclease V) beta subunit
MKPLLDARARERISGDLETTFVVEAAAGTGKTTALVGRVVSIVRRGAGELRGIVAVTFTEAAAGEMKLRIRTALEEARLSSTESAERARLEAALAQLEEARIGTIHGLCADLLRERPIEAAVDPLFQVAAEDEAKRIFDQAFDLWFQRALERPPEGVRRVLRRRRRRRDAGSPRDQLRDAAFGLLDRRDFAAPWRRDPFDREREIDRIVALLEEAAPWAARADRKDDYLAACFQKVAVFVDELHRREAVRPRDHDEIEADLGDLASERAWTWRGMGQWYARGHARAEVLALKERLKAELDSFCDRASADLAAALHAELSPLSKDYERLKARAGKLDFLDLLLRARDLVRDDRAVRQALQRSTTHVFVDEFQDTDPLQAEILLLMAGADPDVSDWTRVVPPPGKLFVVGDPKQSIYRFRRADVALYERIKRHLAAHGAEVLDLVTSFRGAPSIQSMVNATFSARMLEDPSGSQARYVPLAPFREDPASQPTVIALPVPRPYGDWGKITNYAIDASLPDAVGAFVEWLTTSSGYHVTERSGAAPVPVEARHVALIFKRLQAYGDDKTRPYVRALEARGIRHVLVGGRGFHAREEILALRAALSAIEWPDDDLSVYATLRGPFFALGDDALLAWSSARGGSAPFHPLRPRDDFEKSALASPVGDALAVLEHLHRGRNRRPIADTIARLLEATRAHAGLAIWPTGEQALANVLRLIDFARRAEAAGAISFRAFVEDLEDGALRGQASDAPVVEEGTDGVRIMTIHRAKGLEFPVVILVDPTAPLSPAKPSHHVDHDRRLWVGRIAGCAPVELLEHEAEVRRREEEEGIRLGYVAATRARDLLVVPVVGEGMRSGWLEVFDPALEPLPDRKRAPAPAAGCPAFGDDTVLERPAQMADDPSAAVAPGAHRPRAGDHRVVWWDPRALPLDRAVDLGLRQQSILMADEGEVATAAVKTHEDWQARRARRSEAGARPTAPRISATAHAHAEDPLASDPIPLEKVDGDREGHPRGPRFGTLVHAILAVVPPDLDDDRARDLARAHGRLIGATANEVEHAALRVRRALAHPLLRAALAASRSRREVPIAAADQSGRVVEGVVDLAFADESGWTVVDFKTDADLDEDDLEVYRRQVAVYVDAIRRATGEPARGILLSV